MPPGQIVTANGFDGSALGVPNFLGEVGILVNQIFSAEAFGTPIIERAAQATTSAFSVAQARPVRQRSAIAYATTRAHQAEPARLLVVSAASFESASAPRIRASLAHPTARATAAAGYREKARCVAADPVVGNPRSAGSVRTQPTQPTTVSRAVSGGLRRATFWGV